MTCKTCGVQLEEGATVCSACGTQVAPAQPYQPQPYGADSAKTATPGLGLAIAGLVCGILSFFVLAWLFGTLGIIFGGVAKSKGCKSGMATAGIVCGVVGIALWLVMLIACSAVASMAGLF